MKSLVDGLKVVYLDSWDLKIIGVSQNGSPLAFKLQDPSKMAQEIGECLKIELGEDQAKDSGFEFQVIYETTEKSTALNFLSPE
jgi:hypothetical protein